MTLILEIMSYSDSVQRFPIPSKITAGLRDKCYFQEEPPKETRKAGGKQCKHSNQGKKSLPGTP